MILRSATDATELAGLLERPAPAVPGDGARIGIVDPTPKRIALARKVIAAGRPWHGREDIWFSPKPMPGTVAFVFPGLEADFAPRVDDVAALFGKPTPVTDTSGLGRHAAAVLGVGRLLDRALRAVIGSPDAVAGHSVGEWLAMIAGGMVAGEEFDAMVARTDLDALRVPGVEFAVLGCPLARAEAAIANEPDLVVSHENSTNQTVVCGPADAVAGLVARLRAEAVICQVLPFKSGFHTPMLKPHLGEFEVGVPSLRMRPAAIPVWSATTASPFPTDPAAVRDLCVRHLVEPVRFRSLVLAMHDAGVRVFVQAGPGQLGSLIDDTLRERDHLTVAANSPHRPGVEQLRRVAVAVWVAGGDPDFAVLDPRPAMVPDAQADPVVQRPDMSFGRLDRLSAEFPLAGEFAALLRETEAAVAAVIEARDSGLRVSTSDMPYLLDHCLAAQRPGWPVEADRRPVVPATTMVAHMIDAALRQAPGLVAREVRDVRFHRWLDAVPAHRVPVTVRRLGDGNGNGVGDGQVAVSLGDFADAIVVLGTDYAPAPERWPASVERLPELTAERCYDEGWLFHGPGFRGLVEVSAISADTVRGVIVVPPAPGALLDNVGQLICPWLVEHHPDRWIAFPTRFDSIRFHAPDPPVGSTVDVELRFPAVDRDSLLADAILTVGGRPVVSITGWHDQRFDSSGGIGAVHRDAGTATLARRHPDGWWHVAERWTGLATREFCLRKYLGADERAEYDLVAPRLRRHWLLDRVVAKDAVRGALWDRGAGPVHPAELRVSGAPGNYRVSGMHGRAVPDLTVTVDRCAEAAVAMVGADIRITEAPAGRVGDIANPTGLPPRDYLVAWNTLQEVLT